MLSKLEPNWNEATSCHWSLIISQLLGSQQIGAKNLSKSSTEPWQGSSAKTGAICPVFSASSLVDRFKTSACTQSNLFQLKWLVFPPFQVLELYDTLTRSSMKKKIEKCKLIRIFSRKTQSKHLYSLRKNHHLTTSGIMQCCHRIIFTIVTLLWAWYATINNCCCEANFWSEIKTLFHSSGEIKSLFHRFSIQESGFLKESLYFTDFQYRKVGFWKKNLNICGSFSWNSLNIWIFLDFW